MRLIDKVLSKKRSLLEFKEVVVKTKKALVIIVAVCILFSIFSDVQAYEETNSVAGKSSFSRLFVYPTGRMIPSGVLNLSFGGSFATQGGQEYLGLCAIGLGDVAEFEVSTAHIVSNIFNFSEHIGTTALKFRVHEGEPETFNPTVVIALRSNTWSTVGSSNNRDELTGPATGSGQDSLKGVDFQTHFTTLYLASTFDLHPAWSAHLSVAYEEIRIKDIRYNYDHGNSLTTPPDDITEGIISLSIGLEHAVNARTHSIIEFGSLPEVEFKKDMRDLNINPLWQGLVGVRFYVRPLTTIDAGIRYRSDYSGLSDVEIRAGLNLGIDVQKEIQKQMKK